MNLASHLRILWRMLTTRVDDPRLGDRLEQFYAPQAETYDAFRSHLLHGREDLLARLPTPEGGYLLDLGGGTGYNVELLAGLECLRVVEIVDLCPSLLRMACQRIEQRRWNNVHAVRADAARYQPEQGPIDGIIFSYSLTMMPEWYRAIDNAWRMLRPGGHIAVVDYYVSRKWPAPDHERHGAFYRWFWPWLFGFGNVFPSADHLPYLESRFEVVHREELYGAMPYVPFGAPYYLFLGRKPGA
jgi:S-adenosylmethionine-diacylgycerolhomoserine-N-methlytransferase